MMMVDDDNVVGGGGGGGGGGWVDAKRILSASLINVMYNPIVFNSLNKF